MEWKKKVEEYEEKIHNLSLETANKCSSIDMELNARFQVCTKDRDAPH